MFGEPSTTRTNLPSRYVFSLVSAPLPNAARDDGPWALRSATSFSVMKSSALVPAHGGEPTVRPTQHRARDAGRLSSNSAGRESLDAHLSAIDRKSGSASTPQGRHGGFRHRHGHAALKCAVWAMCPRRFLRQRRANAGERRPSELVSLLPHAFRRGVTDNEKIEMDR